MEFCIHRIMDKEIKPIKDPLRNKVQIPSKFGDILRDTDYLDKEVSTIILKPTMIITLSSPVKLLYHLRAVDLGVTLLLKSEWQEDYWIVTELIFNPPTKFIGELMGQGEFVSF